MECPNRENDRILLRKLLIEDAQDLYEVLGDPRVTAYLYTHCYSLTETKQHLKVDLLSYRQQGVPSPYAVVHKADQKVIGLCYFHSDDVDFGEIAFMLNQSYWHQGYMQEALLILIDVGFNVIGYRRIEAKVIEDNQASIHTLQSLGFKKEGVLREYVIKNKRAYDVVMLSLLAKEWRKI